MKSIWFLCLLAAPTAFAAVSVTGLRCESLENPPGIDARQPRLSWMLASSQRSQKQIAYQILVASSLSRLKPGEADWWDSGKVDSGQSIQVRYAGKPLVSHAECFWKVRVWSADGKESSWSRPAKWTMGLLEPGDWKGAWIGLDGEDKTNWLAGTDWIWFPEGEAQVSAPASDRYFRRTIALPADREVRRARLLMTADNECRAFINGGDIGSRNNYRTVKDSDITFRLRPGKNVIAILARNLGEQPSPAGLVALVEIEFDRGEPMIVPTDEQWKVRDKEEGNWTDPEFDDASWRPARKLGRVGMDPWGNVRAPESRRLPARWLRKEFAVTKKVRRATVYYSGLGLSELYLNGEKVGDHVLSPALSEYPKRSFYVTFDVTKQLRRGENAIGAILGNGRFYSPRSRVYANMPSYGFPKLRLLLRLEFSDGSTSEIVSDDSWKLTANGPIVANNEFDGEEFDARKEMQGWSRADFDDSRWQKAEVVEAPSPTISAQMIEPIRVTETLKPIALSEPKPGVFVFDLGTNIVGWCRLKVSGPARAQVFLRHAETLNPDGTLYLANIRGARVTDAYTLRGGGVETWEPRFTYHGFRYVEVTGFPGKPTLQSIEGRVVHDDLKPAGEFTCSNPLLNQIYRNVVRGTMGNYRSIPTDCPQRDERQGWLGDRGEESRGESFLFDTAAFHSKWLQDMADAQRDSGSVPDVCPAYWPIYNDDVTWPSTSVFLPQILYEQYADSGTLERHYDSVRKWIDYLQGFVTNGIIAKDSYGDWCVPPEDPALIHSKDPNRQTDKALLATAYFYHDLRLMTGYARRLNKADDAQRYGRMADQIRTAFNNKFLRRDLGQYDNGTQTSCVLPLFFGLVPEDMRERIFARLVRRITEESKGHIGTGLIGGQYLNRVLTDHGRADLAYTIATQKDYPGWGYMIGKGATTIWELWNGDTADPAMNSGNHVMLVGDLVVWLYENLAGIKSNPLQPGFKHIIMKPSVVGDLKFVRATYHSPYGPITSYWNHLGQDNEIFDWYVEIPPNTTATAYLPVPGKVSVFRGNSPFGASEHDAQLRYEGNRAVIEIGSGKYHFTRTRE